MRFNILACTTIAAIALTACAKKTDAEAAAPTAATEAAPAEAPAAAAVNTAAAAPAAEAAVATSADTGSVNADTGIPECDDYLTKMYACVADKMPAEQRDMWKRSIEESRAGWAATSDKSSLAAGCKAAMDQAKENFAAMGCSF
ncbi:hypothetical protein [Lysobacter terrae]